MSRNDLLEQRAIQMLLDTHDLYEKLIEELQRVVPKESNFPLAVSEDVILLRSPEPPKPLLKRTAEHKKMARVG